MSTIEKQLSAEELKYIDGFCKKKDIHYIDLRIELVDHLAELTLQKMAENPDANFKDAFYLVYKSYGIFGFMEVVEQYGKQMSRHYWREIWQYTKTWITPPRVFLTALLTGVLYLLFDSFEATRVPGLVLYGLLLTASSVATYRQFRRNKKVLNGEKNMLMGGAHQGVGMVNYLLFQIYFQFGINFDGSRLDNILQPGILTFMIMSTLIFSLGNYFLLEKARTQLIDLKCQLV